MIMMVTFDPQQDNSSGLACEMSKKDQRSGKRKWFDEDENNKKKNEKCSICKIT